jgi:vitamin B12 transporter
MFQASPPVEVETVVVYPPRLRALAGEAAFSSVVIDRTDLEASPRLDEALKQAPGVSLFRRNGSDAANPTTQGLSLRSIAGSGAGRALVTLDGAPQNDPFGGWVIWSSLPAEGLDGATIVRGAGAGPYGAGALTGVVALRERPAGGGLQAFDVSGGARDSWRIAASGGGPGLLLTGEASTTDGYYAVRGAQRGAADRPVSLEDASVAMRAQKTIAGVDAAIRLSAFEEKRGAGLDGANSTASGASAAVTLAKPAAEGIGGWRLQSWVRASDLANTSVAVTAGRTGTTPANDQYRTPAVGFGFNAALQGLAGALSWESGVDVRAAQGADNERFRYMSGAYTRTREAGGRTLVGGAYLEGAYDQGPWLVTGGVRLDGWRSYDAVRRERDPATNLVVLDQPSPDASGTTPTARFGVRYKIAEALWLRGAAYSSFRPPTLNELHRPFRVGNDVTEANPSLTPETLKGIEAGLGGDGAISWSATVFFNRLEDPITNVTVGVGPATFPTAGFIPAGGTLRQRANAGRIDAWGVEGDASAKLSRDAILRAAFAYTDAEVDGGAKVPQLTGLRPAQTPKLTATAGLDWRPIKRLTLTADARYETARWEDDLNSRKLGAGLQLDMRAGWKVGRDGEAYLAVDNVTNARLETGETADGIESLITPRTWRVGYTIRR